jgi:thioredoxin 1
MGVGLPVGQRSLQVAIGMLLCLLPVVTCPSLLPTCEAYHRGLVLNQESSEKASLLFFTASWCAPCKKVEPVLVELAEELEEQLQLIIIDFDEAPVEVADFKVDELPTIILLDSDQNLLIRVDGASKDGLEALLKTVEKLFGPVEKENRDE